MIKYNDLSIAYFSMEIGIDEKLPTYSGGLGILAGDTLRSMADMKVPTVGLTLLYKKGYFKQQLTDDGWQMENEVRWSPTNKLRPLDVYTTVKIENRDVKIRAWEYKLKGTSGHENPIIFLDTDLEENSPEDRNITQHLYGYGNKYRLSQEIVLGIGGYRIVQALGLENISKYHMNEGHSSLLTLELCKANGCCDEKSLKDVRKHCVFTTHTPVPAGHDEFDRSLAEQLLGDYLTDNLKKDIFINDKLNMTYLGLRGSEFINGVAKKHGEVSQNMFPNFHIESITNGVHSAFWTAEPVKKMFDKFLPSWKTDSFSLRSILGIPKEKIWDAHQEAKQDLINFVNENYNAEMDSEIFTIGFAKRATAYKRNDMLFTDLERLRKIAEKHKGMQIIFSGKAHPKDHQGKEIIKTIIKSMQQIKDSVKVCYIEDYDISKAKLLVSGVDVWLNTPLRPMEASGTSGMKAAHNGVPQFSTLDGWWLEGYIEHLTGWSIGSHPNEKATPDHEEDVEDLYNKLEYVIVPTYYNKRDEWIEIMRHSIGINGSYFNTNRMVQQYVLNAYFL